MGANSSKPTAEAAQIWKPSTGSIAKDLELLKSGNETESSQARLVQLHIQSRVAEELARLSAQEDAALRDAPKRLAEIEDPQTPSSSSTSTADSSSSASSQASTTASSIAGSIASAVGVGSNKKDSKDSRAVLSRDVEALRSRLENRRKVRDLPAAVDSARNELVRCLRENDRRPLDCWQEVDNFKTQVAKAEREWVEGSSQ